MKKNIFILILLQSCLIFSKNSIIVLYGCSSSGKTSISSELIKILSGEWKYIASNKFSSSGNVDGNYLLWKYINSQISSGYNIIVDTHNQNFLIDDKENVDLLAVFLHCPVNKLIEHINKRNLSADENSHRKIKIVFEEFCNKYKVEKDHKKSVCLLNKSDLKNQYSFTTYFALKKVIKNFFKDTGDSVVFLNPCFKNYDCIIDTGKLSIECCDKKIKKELTLKAM